MASEFKWVVPDEEILPSGLIQLGETPDFSDEKFETLKDGLKHFYTMFWESKDAGHYFIAYNMAYDMRILNEHFMRILNDDPISIPENSIIDVMALAKKLIPVEKISSYTEKNVLVYLYGLPFLKKVSEKLTGSKLDGTITKFILMAFCKQKGFKSFKEIHDFIVSPEILKVFPLGKYKGRSIKEIFEIDRQYIVWMKTSSDILEKNPDLKYTLDCLEGNG